LADLEITKMLKMTKVLETTMLKMTKVLETNDEGGRDDESDRDNESGGNHIETRIDNQLDDENNYEDQLESKLEKFALLDVELPLIFESLDITNLINKELRFPSEEFGNFMKLLVKWNLSDACGGDILKFAKKISNDNLVLPTLVKQGYIILEPLLDYKENVVDLKMDYEHPCHKCPVLVEKMNNIKLSGSQIILRTLKTMKNIVNQGLLHQYS
ncbi:25471_t:CDS:2, partial [Gigaspora rosea]